MSKITDEILSQWESRLELEPDGRLVEMMVYGGDFRRLMKAYRQIAQVEKILDDHTDYEGPMPGTGGYVGGVDPGALDAIVELLRPAGGR